MRPWLALALLLASATARADVAAECDYLEISAITGKTPAIDAELKPLESKLKKLPFKWNTFHKLTAGHITLGLNKVVPVKEQDGSATIVLRDRKDKRLELSITIEDAQGKRVLDTKQSVNAGEWNVWGRNVKEDGHILALQCK